jgi:hypothetical protein
MIEKIILLSVLLAIIAALFLTYNGIKRSGEQNCHCTITEKRVEVELQKENAVVSKRVVKSEKDVLVDKKTKPKRKYKPRVTSKNTGVEVPKN